MADATMDAVQNLVDQRISGLQGENARSQFLATKMYDLPAVYQNQMPATTDPAVLSAAEQTVRAQFRKDMKAILDTFAARGHAPVGIYEPQALAKAAATAAMDDPYADDPTSEGYMRSAQRALAGNGGTGSTAKRSPAPIDTSHMTGIEMIKAGLRGEADPRAAYK